MTKAEKYRALCFYLPYGFKFAIKSGNATMIDKFNGRWLENIDGNNNYDNFKILGLRRTEDINIAEMQEAAKLFIGGEVFCIKPDGVTMIHHLRGGPDIYPEFNLKKFFRGEYGLESLDWIFSRGFDIFGLIDAGLAGNDNHASPSLKNSSSEKSVVILD